MTNGKIALLALRKMVKESGWGSNAAPMHEATWPTWFRNRVTAHRAQAPANPVRKPAIRPKTVAKPTATAPKPTVAMPKPVSVGTAAQ
jgi:hypothetical protein